MNVEIQEKHSMSNVFAAFIPRKIFFQVFFWFHYNASALFQQVSRIQYFEERVHLESNDNQREVKDACLWSQA